MDIADDPTSKLSIWEELFMPVMNKFFPLKRKRIRKDTYP